MKDHEKYAEEVRQHYFEKRLRASERGKWMYATQEAIHYIQGQIEAIKETAKATSNNLLYVQDLKKSIDYLKEKL